VLGALLDFTKEIFYKNEKSARSIAGLVIFKRDIYKIKEKLSKICF